MEYIHTKCGGLIEAKTRTCTRCHKHWNLLAWWTTVTEIRPVPEKQDRPKGIPYRKDAGMEPTRKQYSKWGDAIPGVSALASRLPNWPRWSRLLTSLIFVGIVIVVIWLIAK